MKSAKSSAAPLTQYCCSAARREAEGKAAHQALYEALIAARDAFKTISDKVGGNEQINEPDAAAFYRGYNAVLRADQAIANESLSKITAALALADAAQEGEAKNG